MAPMKLTYFDLYGRGEACRMALAHGKCDWEDNRVSGERWTEFKKAMPGHMQGQVPVLEVDGKMLNQSEAILRFIGMKTGAYPIDDAFACHFADSVINTCSDFEKSQAKDASGKPLMFKMFGRDAVSEEELALMVQGRKPFHAKMADMLGENTFFGGDKPSIADFWVCALIFSFERNTKGKELQAHVYAAFNKTLEGCPKLNTWADKMGGELEEYISNRGSGSL